MMPVHISLTSNDSTETNIKITGGIGEYAEIKRGCSGNVIEKNRVPLREVGISIDHKTMLPKLSQLFSYLNILNSEY